MSQLGYQALARQRFETYDDKLNHVSVAGTYYGTNQGYFGYMGSIRYLYFQVVGSAIHVKIRNFASDAYGDNPAGGVFDFNYANGLVSLQATLVQGDGLSPDPSKGVIANLTSTYISLLPYAVVTGAIVPYTLASTDAIHIELVLLRNQLDGEGS